MTCRQCGCTAEEPCFIGALKVYPFRELEAFSDEQLQGMDLTPCHWIEPDLCSACVTPSAPPLLFDRDHNPLRGAP